MKIYTVHLKKDSQTSLEDTIFVKEGFSLWGAIFQPLWALYNRMWLYALLLVLVAVFFIILQKYAIIGGATASVLKFGFLIFVGFSANDWYRKSLSKKGFVLFDIVSANSLLEAKHRFLTVNAKEFK